LAGTERFPQVIGLTGDGLELRVEVGADGMARLTRLSAPGAADLTSDAALPLLDVIVAGEGRGWSGRRYCESKAGGRFRYAGHHGRTVDGTGDGGGHELRVDLDDPVTGLRAEVFYRILAAGALRSWVRLENRGARPVTIESVTSFLYGGLGTGPVPDDLADLELLWAENDWMAEGRWQDRPLRDALPDIDRQVIGADPRGCFSLTSAGTWSSGRTSGPGTRGPGRSSTTAAGTGRWASARTVPSPSARVSMPGMPRRARSAAPTSRSLARRTPNTTGGPR
jgi:alpha-galactosidase